MSDMMSWWHYMAATQWNFNRYACRLGTIQSNMPPSPLEIKEKSYLTDAPPSDMPTNTLKLYQSRLLHWQYNMYACWPSVTVTNTAADQTCLLVECYCKMDACWTVATQSSCLLTFCHSILHVCWRCASLSAIPAGMVSHYQRCLLVRCSLSAVPAGVMNHYRSCLLVW